MIRLHATCAPAPTLIDITSKIQTTIWLTSLGRHEHDITMMYIPPAHRHHFLPFAFRLPSAADHRPLASRQGCASVCSPPYRSPATTGGPRYTISLLTIPRTRQYHQPPQGHISWARLRRHTDRKEIARPTTSRASGRCSFHQLPAIARSQHVITADAHRSR